MRKSCLLFLVAIVLSVKLFGQGHSVNELVDKGNALYDKGDYISAAVTYREALAIDSNSARALCELANTSVALEKYEQALACAEKIIQLNDQFLDHAYILKGTALDLLNRYDEAIQAYLEGIKKYPDNHLLQYNVAFTYYNQKQYKDAEYHAIKSIELKPDHASSHLLLGECMYHEGKRTQSLLALYYFLLLENNSKRSPLGLALLHKQEGWGVKKEADDKITVNISPDDKSDFATTELVLGLSQAMSYDDKNKDKTEVEKLIDITKSFFDIVTETDDKKKKDDIWWNFYLPFFGALNKSGNTETFCYYICVSSKESGAAAWLGGNTQKVGEFAAWYKEYNK